MRFVVLDVETTGLVPVHDRVVWLALAVVEHGEVTSRWSTLLNPGDERPRVVNDKPLTGKPDFAEIADHLAAMLTDSVLVAHNARFDLAFLKAEFARLSRTMPAVAVVCTMRLVGRLEVPVKSLSLVDCCAAFDIEHQRRHRADEDVEATCRLLARLLPLAEQRGWHTTDDIVEALRPVGQDDRQLTFTIDLNEVFDSWLIDKVGWRPEEEEVETALQRWRASMHAARESRYAAMTTPHRDAHRLWDAIGLDDDRPESWLPALQALAAGGCEELADAWREWGRRCGDDRAARRRAFDAYSSALSAVLDEPAITRQRVDDVLFDLASAAERTAGGVDDLIAMYASHVNQLAMLPSCGECGEAEPHPHGCLGDSACHSANLADRLVWMLLGDSRIGERTFHRRAEALMPVLTREPNPSALARLAAEQLYRHLGKGRIEEAVKSWLVAQDHAAQSGSLAAVSGQLRHVMGSLMSFKQYQAVVTLLAPLANGSALGPVVDRYRLLDELARAYERLGQTHEAILTWQQAIDSGSNVQNSYERLSLTLERNRDHSGALAVIEAATARFDQPQDSLMKRAERCRKRLGFRTEAPHRG